MAAGQIRPGMQIGRTTWRVGFGGVLAALAIASGTAGASQPARPGSMPPPGPAQVSATRPASAASARAALARATAVGAAGGSAIVSRSAVCTLGFNAYRGATPVFLTAGHCASDYPTFRIGDRVLGTIRAVAFPTRDAAYGVTAPTMVGSGTVRAAGRTVKITGSAEAPVGAKVCKAGESSGWTCGRILAKNVTVRYRLSRTKSVLVTGLTKASVCATTGDSGGPWMWGTQAQGLTSGAVTYAGGRCGSATGKPNIAYFQPINPVLKAYGLRLSTS